MLPKILNMIDIKKGLASMVYKCFSKKSSATRGRPEYLLDLILQVVLLHVLSVYISMRDMHDKSVIRNKIISSQKLAEELHKLIIRKFEKQKVH